jgi:hypothetical protein
MSKPKYRIADILRGKADQYELTIFHQYLFTGCSLIVAEVDP